MKEECLSALRKKIETQQLKIDFLEEQNYKFQKKTSESEIQVQDKVNSKDFGNKKTANSNFEIANRRIKIEAKFGSNNRKSKRHLQKI